MNNWLVLTALSRKQYEHSPESFVIYISKMINHSYIISEYNESTVFYFYYWNLQIQ